MTPVALSTVTPLTPAIAHASTGWNNAADCPPGGASPAPEIGAGVLGAMLSVAAVKWFRNRSR